MSQPPVPGAPGPHAPQRRLPQWPIMRKKQTFVVPIIAIVVGALVMALFVVIAVVTTPGIGIVALILTSASAIVGILLLTWLDRWEPEPPHLLIAAFFWGGGVSLVMVFLASPVLALFGGDGLFFSAVISAPLVEESAKGLFLVLVLLTTRRGRSEFNSLTDALVYAGFVGIGFSFIEDLLYLAGESTLGAALTLAGVRIGLGAWSHSIYVAMTAIGLWLGVSSRGAMRFVYPVLGWCVAVLLHAIHNGAAFLGAGAYFTSLAIFSLPAFLAFLFIAIRSHRREGEIVRSQLPIMVHNGWVTPQEASWLSHLRSRRGALAHARQLGRTERTRVAVFRDHATELAFVRHRLDRMGPPYSADLLAQHGNLVALLQADKQWVAQHLPRPAQNWLPIDPVPGQEYGVPPMR
ncbi:MAG: PrsW family intramembrane metalloprotease [Propionibacteriaceae bacterium]|nr:PrsW family intramembrane metalloprotease [Propionibacteriaceae bacterium]